MTKTEVIERVRSLVQSAQTGGVTVLLRDPEDYGLAVDQAIAKLSKDRPLKTILDLAIATAGFRLLLAGGVSPLIAGWVGGATYITKIWSPFTTTAQGLVPNDANAWMITPGPGGTTYLELLDHTAGVGSIVRVEVAWPYVVGAAAVDTTIPAGYARAFEVLAAYFALMIAANGAVRNTGNSSLPGDVVDRRSQSGDYAARAKGMLAIYNDLMGLGGTGAGIAGAGGSTVAPASGFKDLDVPSTFPAGFMFHRPSGVR